MQGNPRNLISANGSLPFSTPLGLPGERDWSLVAAGKHTKMSQPKKLPECVADTKGLLAIGFNMGCK